MTLGVPAPMRKDLPIKITVSHCCKLVRVSYTYGTNFTWFILHTGVVRYHGSWSNLLIQPPAIRVRTDLRRHKTLIRLRMLAGFALHQIEYCIFTDRTLMQCKAKMTKTVKALTHAEYFYPPDSCWLVFICSIDGVCR